MKVYLLIQAFVSSIIAIYNVPYALGMEDVPCDEKEARMFQQIAALDIREKEDIPEESEGTSGDCLDFKKFGRESRRFIEKTEDELKLIQANARKEKERERKKRQKQRKREEVAAIAATAPLSREAAMHAVDEKAKVEAAARKIKATDASMKRVDEKLFPATIDEEGTGSNDARKALHIKLKEQEAARRRKIVTVTTATPDVQYFDIPRSTFASMESAARVVRAIKAFTNQGYTVSMQNNPDGTTARLTIAGLSAKEHQALMVSNIFGTTSGKEVAVLSRGFDSADHLDGPVTIIGAEAPKAPKPSTSGEKERTLPEKRVLVAFQ